MNLTASLAKNSLISIALAIPILSFSSMAEATGCWAIAQDRDGSATLRSQPQHTIWNQIATIPNGTQLEVLGQTSGWLKVYAPADRFGFNYQVGWVAENEIRRTCTGTHSPWSSGSWSSGSPLPSLPALPPLPPLSPYDH